jgi:hypothetical protein
MVSCMTGKILCRTKNTGWTCSLLPEADDCCEDFCCTTADVPTSEPSDTSGSVSLSVRGLMSSVANSILSIFSLKRMPAFAAALGYEQHRATVRISIHISKYLRHLVMESASTISVSWDANPCTLASIY